VQARGASNKASQRGLPGPRRVKPITHNRASMVDGSDLSVHQLLGRSTGATSFKLTLCPPSSWDEANRNYIDSLSTIYTIQEAPAILASFERAMIVDARNMGPSPHGITAILTIIGEDENENASEHDGEVELTPALTSCFGAIMAEFGMPDVERILTEGMGNVVLQRH